MQKGGSQGHTAALALTPPHQLRRGLQPRAVSEEGPQGPLGSEHRWVSPPILLYAHPVCPQPPHHLPHFEPDTGTSPVLKVGTRAGLSPSLQDA